MAKRFFSRGCLFVILLFVGFFLISFLIHKSFIPKGERIGVIEIKGVIKGSKKVIRNLKSFSEDRSIKAIVLRINSPGGDVGAAQEIYEEVKKAKRKKKIIASMGSVAASGGYYIACGADTIFANPGTITGSIGVIVEYPNFKGLMEKIGIKGVVVKSGKYKDIMSPIRDMRKDERDLLEKLIKDIHSQFVEVVSKNRHIKKEKVEEIADGRIFSGRQAKEIGLIDRLGNLEDAISYAAKICHIKGKPKVVYPPRERRFKIPRLFDSLGLEYCPRLYYLMR